MSKESQIEIVETRDPRVAWEIVNHFGVKDNVTDDNWMKFTPEVLAGYFRCFLADPKNHCLEVKLDGVTAGCWLMDCKSLSQGLFEIHTLLLPECRGRLALKAGRAAMQFTAHMDDVRTLESYCPATLPQTLFYARLCGWRDCGVCDRKWIKDGVEHAMTRVEITKRELLCQ